MLSIPVYNPAGEQVGEETIDPADFGGEINKQLLHDVVLMHLAARRVGTVNTRGRSDVAGSTKKLFRQKGTGNARAGSKRTNKRKGGGVAFARRNRDYRYALPKKAVRAAVRMALLLEVPGRPGVDPRRPGADGREAQDQGNRGGSGGHSPSGPAGGDDLWRADSRGHRAQAPERQAGRPLEGADRGRGGSRHTGGGNQDRRPEADARRFDGADRASGSGSADLPHRTATFRG